MTLGDHILVCDSFTTPVMNNKKKPARMLLHPYSGRETIIQFVVA